MSGDDMRADGWIVRDMGGRADAAGRTGQEATDRAEWLGVMPLRARIAPATAAELDAVAAELPGPALGLKQGSVPWWRELQEGTDQ